MTALLDDTLEKIAPDAEALECGDHVLHCRTIVRSGSSADAQLRIFAEENAADGHGDLDAVLRWIADASLP